MRIAFVGDVMLGRLVNEELRHAGSSFPWGDTLPVLERADIRIGNLECVLADGGTPWPGKVFHFRSARRNVACLTAAGFDIVSLANNHVLDFGESALLEMLPILDEHHILHAGAGPDRAAARSPVLWDAGGTTVGFLAITDNEPGWEAGDQTPGVAYVPIDLDDDRATALLRLLREQRTRVDVLIVSAHWGGNWGRAVPAAHRAFARALVEAGADVVYGHSPHIVRGIEVYRTKPIIYSAGDFVDDYAVDEVERNDQSFIFELDTDGGLRLHPTVIEHFQARLAGPNAQPVVHRMQRLCDELGTVTTWNEKDGCLEIVLRAAP